MIVNQTDAFVLQLQTTVEMLRVSIVDPGEQIRILSALVALPPSGVSDATDAVCRRAALSSLALATADYRPTSQNDVEQILISIVPLYDAEILNAANSGDVNAYNQLRQLRAAVVTDLRTRGVDLPSIITITANTILPSLVHAWVLYADATREFDLVQRNPSVTHPAFFPVSFEALSS